MGRCQCRATLIACTGRLPFPTPAPTADTLVRVAIGMQLFAVTAQTLFIKTRKIDCGPCAAGRHSRDLALLAKTIVRLSAGISCIADPPNP